MSGNKTVYLVHVIDTEGPLAELPLTLNPSAPAREWERIPHFDGIDAETLRGVVQNHRRATLGSWEEILDMLRHATAEAQRSKFRDSRGRGWVYNWFCMDHIGFVYNPKRRAMGFHEVFDFYHRMVVEQDAGDAVHWHFHPMSTYREAHKCATSYTNSPELYEILCRRVIERRWFPRAHRSGFQDQRPDSNWFLEQWIPFDYSNFSSDDFDPLDNPDMVLGRLSDWRWAPSDWSTYHPDHNCYQKPGACQRKIARCLNVLNRCANLSPGEMDKAFARASAGQPTLVAFSSHDWRDLSIEVEYVRSLIRASSAKYPDVAFAYSEAQEAFKAVHPGPVSAPLKLDCELILDDRGRPRQVYVTQAHGAIFGSQPFLAIQTRSRRFIHDHFNYGRSLSEFHYVFDDESILPDDVKVIGVAANDIHGNQSIHVIDVDSEPREPRATRAF